MRAFPAFLAALGLWLGSAQATDVRVQVSDPALQSAVQQALAGLSVGGASYSWVNAPDTLFVLGGTAPFSPDVASRSFAGPPPRVEFNPAGPIPLEEAVQAELRRLLKLPPLPVGSPSAGNSSAGTSTPGTPVSGTSSAGTSTSGTSAAGTSAAGTSTAGTSAPTAATSTPPVKAGPADLNGDGVVDTADLAIFMANLAKVGQNLPGDLNGDGRVDDRDLQLFIKAYQLP